MFYTTYFGNLKKLPKNVIPVSICGKAPNGYNGLQYKKLAPKYGFFQRWKMTHDNDYYVEQYNAQVLDHLTPQEVISDLYSLVNKEVLGYQAAIGDPIKNPHIALVCYEKPEDFCHRHLVAEWLSRAGIPCEEYDAKNIKAGGLEPPTSN